MLELSDASLAVLGTGVVGVITLSEVVEQSRRISRAAPRLPLIVDAGSGFGNALTAMRAVEEIESSGAASIVISDEIFPHAIDRKLGSKLSVSMATRRLCAAVAGRDDPSFIVVAKTKITDDMTMDDMGNRIEAYEQCGIDMICFDGISTLSKLDVVSDMTTIPIMLADPKFLSPPEIAERGVRIATPRQKPIRQAVEAIAAALNAQRDNLDSDPLRTAGTMSIATRAPDYARWLALYGDRSDD